MVSLLTHSWHARCCRLIVVKLRTTLRRYIYVEGEYYKKIKIKIEINKNDCVHKTKTEEF